MPRHLLAAGLLGLVALGLPAAEPTAPLPDLSEYKTVEKAVPAQTAKPKPAAAAQPAFLGVYATVDGGKLVAGEVSADSPAAKAGVKKGDVLAALDGKKLDGPDALKAALEAKVPGDSVKLTVQRDGKPAMLTATLTAPSRPQKPGPQRAALGVTVETRKDAEGVVIKQVTPGSAAERYRLKADEVLLKIDDTPIAGPDKLKDVLAAKKPDDAVTLTLLLAEKPVEMKVTLGAEDAPSEGGRRGMGGGGWNRDGGIGGGYVKKDNYKLAIIMIDYPDVKHNPKIPPKEWDDAMFSRDKYTKTITGQTAYGSLADYYWEQSYKHLKVIGKTFDPVEVSKKRAEYGTAGANRTALLTEALDKLLARDGKDALKDYEGVIFIYAGGRMNVARGSLYWPHRASVSHQGKRWPYFICAEGGERQGNISVYCHEFGHMLGLPDLYARPENPGSEGLDMWCAMSNQVGNGRPQHFSAWCKEKLGWAKPVTIDPTVPQKLVLGAIEDSPKELIKVLVRPDGSEYFLLENRRKKGFDTSLPAEGLLIWRVVNNRPLLEESHGIEGPAGPRSFRSSVPFPSPSNDSFTPYTTPSSRSQLGGGLPVHITNIRKLADGRVTFHIGYEFE